MVAWHGSPTMLISSSTPTPGDSFSKPSASVVAGGSEPTDALPLCPPANGSVLGRKPRSLSVDFQSLQTKRGRLFSDGSFHASSCLALKSAVRHLYGLEDFDIDKEPIGCGFYALVYRVTHKVTKQEMVLKMNQMSSIREALLEIQTLNEIRHPNLLKFYGVCVHGGKLWCLTEYVSGGSLDGLISDLRRHLSWPTRVRMALDVAKGMRYLHARSICHRDLTSKNILFREEGHRITCIVADFGLALNMKRHATKFQTGYMATPFWMAPECLRGKPYTEKADVFAYGIILGELLARVPADPAFLPRRKDFALDGLELEKILAADFPEPLFLLACRCGDLLPDKRPSFARTEGELTSLLSSLHSSHRHSRLAANNNNNSAKDTSRLPACIAERFLLTTEPGRSLPASRRLRSVAEDELSVHLRRRPLACLRRSSLACTTVPGLLATPQRHSVFYLDFRGRHGVDLRRTRSLPERLDAGEG